ncbi:FMN-binding protein [Cellulomonas oligotrophica]|uniref:Uncharacterized protein with FMN-binding domain n=1 Tax=Cellulomonas oligotrophica TaxID=931536 RepID=A0A7Y9FHM8_9CELL|nr:FMN-binding protein [Cellulomonas oligotrophica]NYD87490.1 uncharacterized protein with FMN-binding domain [Cellulomonas oligotrophica]GIG33368.1 hypothetical protein Col01nite_25270 [Cellulomonas oligotrophica]
MRRIVLSTLATVSGLVALFSYPTSLDRPLTSDATAGTASGTSTAEPTSGASATADATPSPTAGTTTAPADDTSGTTTAPAEGTTTDGGLADGTYTASTTMRYGAVSVTVTVSGGAVTGVSGTQSSNDPKSEQIAAGAMPTLDQEAVAAAGDAGIAMVSHATYTSQAYAQSLQAALDQAAQA